ncbi:ATP-dependent DNA ligase [Anatilimnocola floriformis]|uniref:ATP-dependent DNA ligase n=1 Tax=Anatilimnocola floriformis TaxID=2948575 RepID=UPI0020C3EC3E|nr:ATP-dependent DNA ligase [Anatilimnocola floriformis]
MQRFAECYRRLDETTKTNRKIAAMREYFAAAAPADAAWAVFFLCGQKPKRLILIRNLAQWATELAEIPEWLFLECYEAVGDLAETIALLLPPPSNPAPRPLHEWMENVLLPLAKMPEVEQREVLRRAWSELAPEERFVFNKLVTGSFRVGVSQGLVVRALAEVAGLSPAVIAHRLMGTWQPTAAFFQQLLAPDTGAADRSRPYPFCLAHPLQIDPQELGPVENWSAEWKWDGIRAQLIRRGGETYLWSRGEEPILERFPEIEAAAAALPEGTVLDGEILAWRDDVLPFAELQKRIGRKTVGKKLLTDVPVRLVVFDLLEEGNVDLRSQPFQERRARLDALLPSGKSKVFMPSPIIIASGWDELARLRESSRTRQVEGLMLKRLDSPYEVGRVTGSWWKWKIEPYSCDAVLIYAQRGSGRRASLYTDYTFAAWQDGQLVPFAKAYSGLSDEEIREVDRFVRQNTIEKFGPVRSVKPELVFELAFEGIQVSSRHKSGLAVRFPRIARWRRDKQPADADTLEMIRGLLKAED